MAIGNYRIATEAARPTHSGTARASKGPARSPDVARTLGQAFANTISDGVSWYKSVQAVGKSLQRIGLDVNDYQSDIMNKELKEEYSKIGKDKDGNLTMSADEVNAEVQRRQAERRKDLDPMQKRSVGDKMDRWQEELRLLDEENNRDSRLRNGL